MACICFHFGYCRWLILLFDFGEACGFHFWCDMWLSLLVWQVVVTFVELVVVTLGMTCGCLFWCDMWLSVFGLARGCHFWCGMWLSLLV